MVHEIPNSATLFTEMHEALNPDGKLLLVEPKLHVGRRDFENEVNTAMKAKSKLLARTLSSSQPGRALCEARVHEGVILLTQTVIGIATQSVADSPEAQRVGAERERLRATRIQAPAPKSEAAFLFLATRVSNGHFLRQSRPTKIAPLRSFRRLQ